MKISSLGVSVVAGTLLSLGCSSGSDGSGSSAGNGAADDKGSNGQDSQDFNLTDGDNDSSGSGASGSSEDGNADQFTPPNGVYIDPPVTECKSTKDCCDQIEGCLSEDQFICTVDGLCGEKRNACSGTADCQGDTLCCSYPDCLPEEEQARCIPANVAPKTGCSEAIEPGAFSPSLQCRWPGPQTVAELPDSTHVFATPLVADLPNISGTVDLLTPNGSANELVVISAESASLTGVIRIIDGQSCELKETISTVTIASATAPALADLNGNGNIEIVARRSAGGVVIFEWDEGQKKYKVMKEITTGAAVGVTWSGVSIHDTDDDGDAEIFVEGAVYDWKTGTQIQTLTTDGTGRGIVPTVADFDGNNKGSHFAFEASQLYRFEHDATGFTKDTQAFGQAVQISYANFGTLAAGGDFIVGDMSDETPEIVTVGGDNLRVYDFATGTEIMSASTGRKGGHPNIGDFDGDGVPEIGVASGNNLRVFDLGCAPSCGDECDEGCSGQAWLRWSKESKDFASSQTSATLFDFDGDGEVEVVYADECFLRVYKGATGEVLYSSYRTSVTYLEAPLVADIDRDDNTEIVVNSNATESCDAIDKIHPGIACETAEDCPETSTCGDGFCRCTTSADCRGSQTIAEAGLECTAPIGASASSSGNVCRAAHPGLDVSEPGIRVLKDRLDRWSSSGTIWNQQNFSITNINADGTIPRTSEWKANWMEPGLNNYRQNSQGSAAANALPDITGAFTADNTCVKDTKSAQLYIQATVCNRGLKGVGAELPASFYDKDGSLLCTSYTNGPVPINSCKLVLCAVDGNLAGQEVKISVNDDGKGGRTTLECHSDNNTDTTTVDSCEKEIEVPPPVSIIR